LEGKEVLAVINKGFGEESKPDKEPVLCRVNRFLIEPSKVIKFASLAFK